jgi:hypothetical protein
MTKALHEFLLDKCAPRIVVTIKGRDGRSVDVEQTKRTSGHRLSMSVGEFVLSIFASYFQVNPSQYYNQPQE